MPRYYELPTTHTTVCVRAGCGCCRRCPRVRSSSTSVVVCRRLSPWSRGLGGGGGTRYTCSIATPKGHYGTHTCACPSTYFFGTRRRSVTRQSTRSRHSACHSSSSSSPRRSRTKEPATCGGPDLPMDKGHAFPDAMDRLIDLASSQPPQISREK